MDPSGLTTGDPQVYTPKAKPGYMKHTFTGIRDEFDNVAIHMMINMLLPMRREFTKRSELHTTARWDEPLVTWVQEGLEAARSMITAITAEFNNPSNNPGTDQNAGQGQGAHAGVFGQSMPPLSHRREQLQKFVDEANSANISLEQWAQTTGGTHRDRMLLPADDRKPALQFDWTGADEDYPQPTPTRFPNPEGRMLISQLDRLIVEMTRSHSSKHVATVNMRDAAAWQTILRDMFVIADRAGVTQNPYAPTGWERSDLDNEWNADGQHDVPLAQGPDQTRISDDAVGQQTGGNAFTDGQAAQ